MDIRKRKRERQHKNRKWPDYYPYTTLKDVHRHSKVATAVKNKNQSIGSYEKEEKENGRK